MIRAEICKIFLARNQIESQNQKPGDYHYRAQRLPEITDCLIELVQLMKSVVKSLVRHQFENGWSVTV